MSSVLSMAGPEATIDFVVSDDLVGQLHRSGAENVHSIVEPFSHDQRAAIAGFCWRRAHLRNVGLAVAAQCDERSLNDALGPTGGVILFAQSRQSLVKESRGPSFDRRKITLASLQQTVVFEGFQELEETA
jgi:hypothetical protein